MTTRLTVFLVFLLAGLGAARADETRMRDAVDLAAAHLIKVQKENGLFVYDVSLTTGRPTGKASLVRQVGTAFSLAEYFAATRNAAAGRALRAHLESLQKRSVVYRKRSRWLVTERRDLKKARLGATALALLTELLYYRASGDGRFERAREGWKNGLLALRRKNRGFRKLPGTNKESPYFNGEAWLALAHYQETFRDAETAATLESLDAYLLKTYGKKPEIGFYHWGIMAAAIRYRTTRDLRFLDFIEAQTRIYLTELRPTVKPGRNTCYALEGLLTASNVLRASWPGAALHRSLDERLDAEIAKNLSLQLAANAPIPEPVKPNARNRIDPAKLPGLFFRSDKQEYSRIDYTQHCLSAFLKVEEAKPRQAGN